MTNKEAITFDYPVPAMTMFCYNYENRTGCGHKFSIHGKAVFNSESNAFTLVPASKDCPNCHHEAHVYGGDLQ